MARANVKVVVSEKGPGIAAFAAELAGVELRIGVQGEEAAAEHPNSDMTVGAIAEKHELGLGVPERSWLRAWFDRNEQRCQAETRAAMQAIMTKKLSRKKATEQLGYKWVELIRQDIVDGKVTPALAPSTVERKGHGIPLWETGTMTNAITFKLFLAQIKNIQDPKVRQVVLEGPKKEENVKQPSLATGPNVVKVSALKKMAGGGASRSKAASIRGGELKSRASARKTRSYRAGPSFSWAWLLRLLKKALKPKKSSVASYRNHGASGVVRGSRGRTGLAGRRAGR